MTWPTNRLPSSVLARVRLAALVFAVVNVTMVIPFELNNLSVGPRVLSLFAIVVLLVDFGHAYWRKRAFWAEPVVSPLALLGFGAFVNSTSALIGFAISIVVTQSLYGSLRSTVVRVVATTTASISVLLLAPEVSPSSDIEPSVPLAAVVLVPICFAVFMRLLGSALGRQEQAGAREALLAHTGRQLLGLTDLEQARAITIRSLHELCALTPELAMISVRRDGDHAEVRVVFGVDRPSADRFTSSFLTGLDATDIDAIHRFDSGTDSLNALLGSRRNGWIGFGLGSLEPEVFLLAGSSGAGLSEGIVDALLTLLGQFSLADTNCRTHSELAHLAHRDQLTTMPNRRAFFEALTAAVDAAATDRAECALLVIDLDDFKQVNDTYGHAAGDELLIEIAERLKQATSDAGVAARFGGDEFAVLLTGRADQARSDEVANRIREGLQEPIHLSCATVTVGASIGVVNAAPGVTAGDLMRCADVAMYSAKARGKNRVERFTQHHHGGIAGVRQLEDHLPRALERRELVVHFQPLMDLKTGRCQAVEALARWQHPTLGLLEPKTFISIAERQGLIAEMGAHILAIACTQVQNWMASNPGMDLRCSVNVSVRQFATAGFDQVVRAALYDSGLAPERLILEFAESEILEQDLPRQQLAAIAASGVKLALDDFGIGNTSLARLQSMALQQIKIDRSLLNDDTEDGSSDLTRLIMSVSQFLRLETVAKNVETEADAAWARHAGMTLAQGNFFGPPVPIDQLTPWLTHAAP